MSTVQIDGQKALNFGEQLEKYSRNLVNTANVYEGMVTAQSKVSGSEFLVAVGADVRDIRVSFEQKAKTLQRNNSGLKDYIAAQTRMHRN